MHHTRRRWLGGALIALLGLSACVEQGGSSGANADAEGIAVGSDKDSYVEAFADLAPETITIQSVSSPGEGASVPIEAYAEDLEEYTGGKLSVEIVYGNSVAAPDEAPQALADGRIDMDYVFPLYDPSRFPRNAAFADVAFAGDHSPEAGTLSAFGGLMEAALEEETLAEEFEEAGMKLLLPFAPNTSVGMLCREPRDTLSDLDGAQVRVSGAVQSEQVKALGASPVSLPYSEQYQALQRGTIDCALTAAYATETLGTVPLAPNFVTGSEAGFARVAAPYAFGLAKWESLALPYQQVIFDRLVTWVDVMLSERLLKTTLRALEQMESEGGEIQEFDAEADAALQEKNQELLDAIGSSDAFGGDTDLGANAVDRLDHWHDVAVEMGYSEAHFSEWVSETDGEFDAQAFVERFFAEVMSEHRPS